MSICHSYPIGVELPTEQLFRFNIDLERLA
jgi:hypothetical protein